MVHNYVSYHSRLTCKHVITTSYVEPGTELFCRRCWTVRSVVECSTRWYWHCQSCGVTRYYLAKRIMCENRALEHWKCNRDHVVTSYDPDGRMTWTSHPTQNIQQTLPLGLDDTRR